MGKRTFIDPNESDAWSARNFLFDTELKAMAAAKKLRDPWGDIDAARQMGRWALEYAIRKALNAAEIRDLPDLRIHWDEAFRLASNSAKHLNELIRWLGAKGTEPATAEANDIAATLNRQIRADLYRNDPRSPFGLEIEESRQEALRRAQVMVDARDAAQDYASFAAENMALLSGGHKTGEPEKLAFAGAWAVAWLTLTGKSPSGGRSERNPFGRLVTLAWEDACGERETSFAQAISNISDPQLLSPTDLPPWAVG